MSTDKVKKSSLVRSAGTVSAATAFSRVLGLIREQVMAYFFGAGLATDAFVTAFRIPNLLRDMFAEGALSSAFVPVFKGKLVKESEQGAFRLASTVLTLVIIVVGLVVLLGIVAAPVFVYLFANGFTSIPGKFALTVDLTRIMFVYLLLVSVSAMIMGMLNSFGRFGIPAISPALFNSGVVLTVVALYRYFEQPVYTLAIGVLIGGLGQVAIQLPSLWRIGYRFRPRVNFLDEGVKKVVRLITPMIVGLSAGRINILVSTLVASFLMEGSISYLNYSYRLMHFPLGVFAVALGIVALPKVSEMVARKDIERLSRTYMETINLNMFVVIPSAVFLALMGHEIVDLIYRWGAFSELDSFRTTQALLHYSYGLVGFAAIRVTVPFYYAFGDSRLPMRFSILSVVINIALYYPMVKVLDFAGLAAATSIGSIVNFVLLVTYLPSKGVTVSWGKLGLNLVRITIASLLAFHIALLLPFRFAHDMSTLLDRLLGLFVPAGVAAVFYLLFCFLLRVQEVQRLTRFVRRKQQSEG
jgi:putative peptidoglycan lipid II flippase